MASNNSVRDINIFKEVINGATNVSVCVKYGITRTRVNQIIANQGRLLRRLTPYPERPDWMFACNTTKEYIEMKDNWNKEVEKMLKKLGEASTQKLSLD